MIPLNYIKNSSKGNENRACSRKKYERKSRQLTKGVKIAIVKRFWNDGNLSKANVIYDLKKQCAVAVSKKSMRMILKSVSITAHVKICKPNLVRLKMNDRLEFAHMILESTDE